MPIIDPYLANVDLNLHLRDARHAHQLYTEHNLAFAPKNKFLYHVVFQPTSTVSNATKYNTFKFQKEIGVLAKTVDLPQFRASIETKQQYNRKKNVQTRIDYQDVTIRFHDDNTGVTRAMLQEYYNYYFVDGHTTSSPRSNYNPRDKYSASVPTYGLNNGTTLPFFEYIKIYQLSRQQWFSYTLVNPLISQWGHDTLDSGDSAGIMENSIILTYESVLYDQGVSDTTVPTNFTSPETRYDVTSSPAGLPDGVLSGYAVTQPALLPTSSPPQQAITNISNSASSLLSSFSQFTNTISTIGGLAQTSIAKIDTQNANVASRSKTTQSRSLNTTALIDGLDANPQANASFIAKALNSGALGDTSFAAYQASPDLAKSAMSTELRGSLSGGSAKLKAFANDAINKSKG